METLPKAISADAFVNVTIVAGGDMAIPDWALHLDGTKEFSKCPVYTFLIEHEKLGKKVFFDQGLSTDNDVYPPSVKQLFANNILKIYPPEQNLAEIIRAKRGISADQIDQIIFSHFHFDHCIPFASYFPAATALFGPGTVEGAKPGWPSDPDSIGLSDFLDKSHPNARNVDELPPSNQHGWQPFGSFHRAWDLWEDGSLWLIDAPGHAVGNLIAAARLENGHWIVMGGDCAHSKHLLDGDREFGVWKTEEGVQHCIHGDLESAKDTLKRLQSLGAMKDVHVAMSHVYVDESEDPLLQSLLLI